MKIGTHDGRFHCDEALACAMLIHFTQQYKGAQVFRSRDPKVWETCDILVDVGGKYEPPKLLDHHQIQFQGTYPGFNVKLSSAGLVYMHFQEIIPNIINSIVTAEKQKFTFELALNEKIVKQIREKIYRNFIIYVDANDNGIDKINDKPTGTAPTTLWARIGKLNPMWWDEHSDEHLLFTEAIKLTKQQLYTEVRQIFLGSIQTKNIVREAFSKRKDLHPSGRIILLQKYVPWQSSLYPIEEENKAQGQIYYVIFPEKSGDKWRIQGVPVKEGAFELRKPLKEQWRGIKDMQKLVQISGIPDITFVHASGFIGGATSKQSTIKMGEISI